MRERFRVGLTFGLAHGLSYGVGLVVVAMVFDLAEDPPKTTRDGLVAAGQILAVLMAPFIIAIVTLLRGEKKPKTAGSADGRGTGEDSPGGRAR